MTDSVISAPKIGLDSHQLLSLLDYNNSFKALFIDRLSKINRVNDYFIVIYSPNQENRPVYFEVANKKDFSKAHLALCVVMVVIQKYKGNVLKAKQAGIDQLYEDAYLKVGHQNIFDLSDSEIRSLLEILLNDLL